MVLQLDLLSNMLFWVSMLVAILCIHASFRGCNEHLPGWWIQRIVTISETHSFFWTFCWTTAWFRFRNPYIFHGLWNNPYSSIYNWVGFHRLKVDREPCNPTVVLFDHRETWTYSCELPPKNPGCNRHHQGWHEPFFKARESRKKNLHDCDDWILGFGG